MKSLAKMLSTILVLTMGFAAHAGKPVSGDEGKPGYVVYALVAGNAEKCPSTLSMSAGYVYESTFLNQVGGPFEGYTVKGYPAKDPNDSYYDVYGATDVFKVTLKITGPTEFALSIQETDSDGKMIDPNRNCSEAKYKSITKARWSQIWNWVFEGISTPEPQR